MSRKALFIRTAVQRFLLQFQYFSCEFIPAYWQIFCLKGFAAQINSCFEILKFYQRNLWAANLFYLLNLVIAFSNPLVRAYNRASAVV